MKVKTLKQFGAFPPDKFIPEPIRAIVDRFVELRADADAAAGEVQNLRGKIKQAEVADIVDAANAIVSGEEAKATTKHHDAAVKAAQDAERQREALKLAVSKVNAEVQAAFAGVADEVFSLADAEFERARGEYIKAIETLVAARRDWSIAVGAREYAEAVTHGQNDATYHPQRIGDDEDYKVFRDEAMLPADILFAQKVRQYGGVHYATHVQALIAGAHIPSYAIGNTLTILEQDYERVIHKITTLSSWYEDGDGISRDTTPIEHVTIDKVPAVTDGMRRQCPWLHGSPSGKR